MFLQKSRQNPYFLPPGLSRVPPTHVAFFRSFCFFVVSLLLVLIFLIRISKYPPTPEAVGMLEQIVDMKIADRMADISGSDVSVPILYSSRSGQSGS